MCHFSFMGSPQGIIKMWLSLSYNRMESAGLKNN